MSNEWDKYAVGWDEDESVHLYAQNVFEQLSSIIEIDGLSVFDFGCGTGALSELLSPRVKDIVALDTSFKMIKILDGKHLSNVRTFSEPLTQSLIDSHHLTGRFDLIVASSVCGFLPDYEMLGLLASLLKRGGLFTVGLAVHR